MRKMNERTRMCAAFSVLTAIGFLLRYLQLATGYDADGLPLPGAGVLLGVFSVGVAAAAALYCRKLQDRTSCEEAFSFSMPAAIASFAGAGLILAGCLTDLSASGLDKVSALLGIVSALVIVAQQGALYNNKTMHPMIGMIPIAFYIVRLICDFKQWSTDPIILDYWVKLFAMLAILLASYYCGGFAINKGKRGVTVFFCLMAVFFSVLSLADGGAEFSLIAGGSMLWEGACGWQLLRPDGDPAGEQTPEE
ncbi:MAG: hypothetical protein IKM36_07460 [Oscillospiraceae bacterium]|nr:hypothetical protein [Oscillospiraceae bacterium]